MISIRLNSNWCLSLLILTLFCVIGTNSQASRFNYTIDPDDGLPLVTSTFKAPNDNTVEPVVLSSTILPNSAPSPPQKPPPALGLPCNVSIDCKANFSECANKVCSCRAGYFSSEENLQCLKVVSQLGDECSEDEQCTKELNKLHGPTTCLNFKCTCAIGLTLVDGKCQGPKVLNSPCESDDDCSISKSYCKSGHCMCYDGFVPNSENNVCLPVNVLLQKLSGSQSGGCSADIQCQNSMGESAICVIKPSGGVCECEPGFHELNNKCMAYKDLGDECSTDAECLTKDTNTETPDSRICNNSVCSCNLGWTKEDSVCVGGGSTQNTLSLGLLSILVIYWVLGRHH